MRQLLAHRDITYLSDCLRHLEDAIVTSVDAGRYQRPTNTRISKDLPTRSTPNFPAAHLRPDQTHPRDPSPKPFWTLTTFGLAPSKRNPHGRAIQGNRRSVGIRDDFFPSPSTTHSLPYRHRQGPYHPPWLLPSRVCNASARRRRVSFVAIFRVFCARASFADDRLFDIATAVAHCKV